MIDAVINPVVIPGAARRQDDPPGVSPGRRRLPLANLVTHRTSSVVYGLAIMDCRGRVAERAMMAALSWTPGTRLTIHDAQGLLLVRRDTHGLHTVTTQGHLRLPAQLRHSCGLATCDRILLAGYPSRDLLVVHPPAALDELLTARHAGLWGGDPA